METYFTSDLHLDQRAVCKYRTEFNSVLDHNEAILQAMSALPARSVLWVLGDWIFKSKHAAETVVEWCKRTSHLHQINFVFGNHDELETRVYFEVFNKVHGFFRFKEFWISHCPMHQSELFRKVNIHGHIHSGTNADPLFAPPYQKGSPYFNVNWDFWKRPVALTEIRDLLGD